LSTPFTFDEKTIRILANFAAINPSMVIQQEQLSVINTTNSCIGFYTFGTTFDFEEFGLYEAPEFLSAISVFDTLPAIEVKDKYLVISGKNDKLKYFTTAKNLLPVVPDVKSKFEKVQCELEFTLSADKLAIINKFSSILKSKYIFFETEKKRIRITVANELESSNNSYELFIEDDIQSNKLTAPVKIALDDFKILPGEYTISLSQKISRWTNLNGAVYYLACSI
jgi:hypothetical protein